MQFTRLLLSLAMLIACVSSLRAEEPNETFATATVLSPGVTTVADSLSPGSYPDTMVGARDQFGEVYVYDDDFSPVGSGTASGLEGIDTNSGSISFAVTGYPDEFFIGDHGWFGEYQVFVDVYDFFDDPIDSFSEIRTLQPGVVDDFSYSNFEWIGGTYDVYIDNTLDASLNGDVDFFTFTGLTPGAAFAVETVDPLDVDLDSYLGWFDDAGELIVADDDGVIGTTLSRIEGVVPAVGTLTFAVTGFGDETFFGNHFQGAVYELELTIGGALSPADFNGDMEVDGDDLADWKAAYGPNAGGDADGDDDSDGADFLIWQREVTGEPTMTAAAVPEPASVVLLFCALGMAVGLRKRTG